MILMLAKGGALHSEVAVTPHASKREVSECSIEDWRSTAPQR